MSCWRISGGCCKRWIERIMCNAWFFLFCKKCRENMILAAVEQSLNNDGYAFKLLWI